jgi:predicted Zn-dependent protease
MDKQEVHGLKKITFLLLLALAVFFGLFPSGYAAHYIDSDSVKNGAIRYKNSSRDLKAVDHADHAWNQLTTISVYPASSPDLIFYDANYSTASWDGLYTPKYGADTIHLNIYYMDKYTTPVQARVAAHEMGHALGLGDHEEYSYRKILMYKCSTCNPYNTPTHHDRQDYYAKWRD